MGIVRLLNSLAIRIGFDPMPAKRYAQVLAFISAMFVVIYGSAIILCVIHCGRLPW